MPKQPDTPDTGKSDTRGPKGGLARRVAALEKRNQDLLDENAEAQGALASLRAAWNEHFKTCDPVTYPQPCPKPGFENDPYTMNAILCDHDGIVRSGEFFNGTEYPCTGHAHFAGQHIRCTSFAHFVDSPNPSPTTTQAPPEPPKDKP